MQEPGEGGCIRLLRHGRFIEGKIGGPEPAPLGLIFGAQRTDDAVGQGGRLSQGTGTRSAAGQFGQRPVPAQGQGTRQTQIVGRCGIAAAG
ncbi:hypothetical protein RGUI_0775 [Rhodovulum sp. P5]|nr:hypothetical protein RGUI_0775 [Rhodovulum sp. P5]